MNFAALAVCRIKLKEREKKDKCLDLAREMEKLSNMNVTSRPIVIESFDTVTKDYWRDWRTWGLEDEWIPSKLLHYWEQPEFWEESWRLEETCCQSNFSERPSAIDDVKNFQGVNNNNCNCKWKIDCPMNGIWKFKNVVNQASIFPKENVKDETIYIGISSVRWKLG